MTGKDVVLAAELLTTPQDGSYETSLKRRAFNAIAVTLWLSLIVPNVIEKGVTGGRQFSVGEVVSSPAATGARYALYGLLAGLCLYALMRWSRAVYRELDATSITIWISIWASLIVSALINNQFPPSTLALLPLVLLGIWATEAKWEDLGVLALLGLLSCAICLSMVLIAPGIALYSDIMGQPVAADKGLLDIQPLTGFFVSGNNLGQYLALTFPLCFILKRRVVSLGCAAVIFLIVIWSASRSSLAAILCAGVVLAVVTLFDSRRRLAPWILAPLLLGSSLFPFVFSSTPDAFSDRGLIWFGTINYLSDHLLFGLGGGWYEAISSRSSSFGNNSPIFLFHAHNQFLQMLATGGTVAAGLYIVLNMRLLGRLKQIRTQKAYCVAVSYMAAYYVSGSLEVNLGLLDRLQFWLVALLPLSVILFLSEKSHDSMDRGLAST